MSGPTLWLVILAAGIITFSLRSSFIALAGKVELGTLPRRALRLLPAAALCALVTPAIFYQQGTLDLSLGNERLLAGAVAALVAWRTRSPLLTVACGMAALYLFRYLTGLL
ncbi:AzlD domain-containing protein [Rubrobacter aplysinae]|uniref:AzlD domain-containing protein n=1 Tax=Rubrobacter aplysinae TaxID=909625 RepID=UPI00064B8C90|nr:AzlD domain-containing protein [Rubrobacter aplysinae]